MENTNNKLGFIKNPNGRQIKDLTGIRYGKYTVLGFSHIKDRKAFWTCQCECGNQNVIVGYSLKNGNTKSCGCNKKIKATKHAHRRRTGSSRTYSTWQSMRGRCENPKHNAYSKYGNKGVTVCERWLKFENFLEDMGERPVGKTLDRKENNKGYYPENCRWATNKEQGNNKTTNHLLTFQNKTQSIAQWAEEIGIKYHTINSRIKKGWSVERTLTEPVKIYNKSR